MSSVEFIPLSQIKGFLCEYNIFENSTIIHDFDYIIVEWHNHDHDRQYIYEFIEKNIPGHTIVRDACNSNRANDGRHTMLGKNKLIESIKKEDE